MSAEKLRVLLAEGSSGSVTTALRELYAGTENHLELTVVSGVSTLLATLEVVHPELILLDLAIAQPDALEAVRLMHRAAPEIPLVVVANEATRDLVAGSLKQGALDFLTREHLDPATIGRVLRGALEQNTLGGLASLLRDPVTDLYNREAFLTLGGRALNSAARRDRTLILLCTRIENLASIRSEYGPRAAENSLCEISVLLAGSFRRTDIVARVGESQFAALAVDAVEPSGPVLCQRLEKRIGILNRDAGPCGPLELRMSVGFWRAGDTTSFPEFLDRVETKLRNPEAIQV